MSAQNPSSSRCWRTVLIKGCSMGRENESAALQGQWENAFFADSSSACIAPPAAAAGGTALDRLKKVL
jgi:hypothetical protein